MTQRLLTILITLCVYITYANTANACTNPAGVAGEIIFNLDHKVLQFCNSEKWTVLGGGSNAKTAGTNGEIQFNDNGNLGASSQLFWNKTNGHLGIGTNTPASKLDVAGMIINRGNTLVHGINTSAPAGAQVWQSVINTSNGHYSLGYRSDDIPTSGSLDFVPFRIQAFAPNHSLSINTSGNVAIGNSTASEKLHVYGNIKVQTGSAIYTDIIHANITINTASPAASNGVTCLHSGTFPAVTYTDCTCPTNYMALNGGTSANTGDKVYIRETRASGIGSWRVACKNYETNATTYCAAAHVTCARILPN